MWLVGHILKSWDIFNKAVLNMEYGNEPEQGKTWTNLPQYCGVIQYERQLHVVWNCMHPAKNKLIETNSNYCFTLPLKPHFTHCTQSVHMHLVMGSLLHDAVQYRVRRVPCDTLLTQSKAERPLQRKCGWRWLTVFGSTMPRLPHLPLTPAQRGGQRPYGLVHSPVVFGSHVHRRGLLSIIIH